MNKPLIDSDKVLFFDFDDTIAATEPAHAKARDMVLKPFGVTIDDWSSYIGIPDIEIFKAIKTQYHLRIDIPAIVHQKLLLSKEHLIESGVQPIPQVKEYITQLPNTKYVLTGQDREFTLFFLKRWGLVGYFADIISLVGSSVSKAEKIIEMGILPEKAVLFEDSERIITAATAKGIRCIRVKKDGSIQGI